MQNRTYQDNCHQAIKDEYNKGVNRQLVVMATGTGKTVVFGQLPERLKQSHPGQQLVLAHREELVNQAVDTMRMINPAAKVDKEKAEHHADTSTADIIVASVATLGRKDNKRIQQYNWERIDKYVTDEAHHSVAQTYLNIYEASGILREGDKRLFLGVTATPQRGDGKALAKLFQKISFVYSMRQAIEEGWLVDVCGIRVSTDTSLDAVKTVGGDFAQDDLALTVNNPTRNQLIVKTWRDSAEGRQTVGFTVDIKHAQDLAAMFQHYGVKAEAVWGSDPDRAEKLAKHKAKDITVLLNCGVLTEGYDDWRIGCVLLARPTKSSVLFTQMVGRGTRLEEGTGNLLDWTGRPIKSDCIVIDVVDASSRHSLITLPTLMGMSAKLNLKGKSVVKTIQRIERAQVEHPRVDFSTLTDISQISALVEQVNMFDVKLPPEVEANSDLKWHAAADGGFILQLPEERGAVHIKQNILDFYEISGTIDKQKYKGERATIEDAFRVADKLLLEKAASSLTLMKQKEHWHNDPPTAKQLKSLRWIFKGKQLPLDLTKGMASDLISRHHASKA